MRARGDGETVSCRKVQLLLSDFVNERVEPKMRRAVLLHLADCHECRDEAFAERVIKANVVIAEKRRLREKRAERLLTRIGS